MALVDQKNKITTETQLRKIISGYPKILDKRICSELDPYCLELISFSKLVIAAYSNLDYSMMPLSKKDVVVVGNKTIALRVNYCTSSSDESKGNGEEISYASLYFLVPGVDHGLRVNGTLKIQDSKFVLTVKSAYLHCARAAARAELWAHANSRVLIEHRKLLSPLQILSESPYLLMKTMNEMSETELSPRGDKAGFVYLLDEQRLFIPERPGNKVAVSLRNILRNNEVELLFFLPGTDYMLHVVGDATLTNCAKLLDVSAVNNKRPKLGIIVDNCQFLVGQSSAIMQTQPWIGESHVNPHQLTRFSKALSVHMNGDGLIGKTTSPFIDAVVKNDMRHLY